MKKLKSRWWMAGFMAVLLAGGAWVALADEDKPMMGDEDGGANRIEKMKEKLGLTDDQTAKMKDLFKKQWQETKPLRDQMKADMDALQQKVDAKASDAELKKALDALSAERKQIQEKRQRFEDQLRNILTPTQQAKFVLGMREKGREMMKKWMKRRMNKDEQTVPPPSEDQAGEGEGK